MVNAKKKNLLYSLLLVPAVLLAACSDEQENKKEIQEEQTIDEKGASKADQLSLEQDGVDQEAFNEALDQFSETSPERIVTTSVPLAEMLDILDVTPVGVPTSTNPLPKNFEEIDQIGSPMAPDLEVMTKLKPDLVLGANSLKSSLEESVKRMDVQTAYLPTDSFDDLKLSFKVLGTYFEKETLMNEKLQQILAKENELVEKAAGKELPKVLLMIGTSDSFMVMNEKSYVGSLVERIGADNIATSVLKAEDTYSPMNMEEIVVADPDLVFVLASGDHGASEQMLKDEIEENELWTKLSAYKNDNIHILDPEVFGVTSIQNVETALTEFGQYFFE